MFKKSIAFLILLAFVSLVGKGWHWMKDGFTLRRVAVSLPEESAVSSFPAELEGALAQEYRYLSRGHQNYAFLSADGRYVLKLPRYDLYRQPFWLRSCRFSFLEQVREDFIAEKKKRLLFLTNSFRIAFQDLKEETSLLYMHLGQTKNLKKAISIRDRIGRSYTLDLDSSGFLLQKRQELMMPAYQKAYASGDRDKAKEILLAFLDMNAVRARKGIYNKDPSFLRNFGLDGMKGIQIDVGSFYRPEQGDFTSSFLKTVGYVKDWLSESSDPEMERWFDEKAAAILQRERE